MKRDELILHFLNGTLSPEEQVLFNALQKTDASFSAQLEQSEAIWNLSENIVQDEIDINLDLAWLEFEKLKSEGRSPKQTIVKPMWYNNNLMRIAAIAIIILAGVIIFKESKHEAFIAGITHSANSNREILLSMVDGSEAFLGGNSQLEIEQNYNQVTRTTRLTGTAFFVVKPDKDRVFEVVTNHLKTIVKGTTFLVRTDDHSTTVGVQTGIVEVQIGTKTETLRAGEQLVVSFPGGVIERSGLQVAPIDDLKALTKVFQNAKLSTILEQVKLLYNITIDAEPELLEQRYTVDFNNIEADQVLKLVTTLTQTSLHKNGEIYVLKQ